METNYKKESNGSITVSINVKLEGTMLTQEEQIEQALKELGLKMSQLSVESFDTDGAPIIVSNEKYTSKGQEKKRFRRRTEK
jgi:uncharacterized Fe-S cluster-containing radical SAM superfamily enzyme